MICPWRMMKGGCSEAGTKQEQQKLGQFHYRILALLLTYDCPAEMRQQYGMHETLLKSNQNCPMEVLLDGRLQRSLRLPSIPQSALTEIINPFICIQLSLVSRILYLLQINHSATSTAVNNIYYNCVRLDFRLCSVLIWLRSTWL